MRSVRYPGIPDPQHRAVVWIGRADDGGARRDRRGSSRPAGLAATGGPLLDAAAIL
jgi:hypothetical protein